MSLSNEWYEHHLTPAGWIDGNVKLDVVGIREVPIPLDRVLTIRCHEYQSCSFAKMEMWRETIWRTEDKAQLKMLTDTYGTCPDRYVDWPEQ